jgi:nicotinate dehydrogenase subunit A
VASFQLTVNGRDHHVDVPAGTSLLEVLRNDIGDKSAKFGCGLGQCGACVVWINGDPTPACDTAVEYVRGEVRTLVGLGRADALHPIQSAFLELQAGQCGYCIAGIIMSAAAPICVSSMPCSRRQVCQQVRERDTRAARLTRHQSVDLDVADSHR